jgi:hypothetical protein
MSCASSARCSSFCRQAFMAVEGQPKRQTVIAFAAMTAVTALGAAFLYTKIPHQHVLMVMPEVLALLALILPIIMWQALSEGKRGARIAAAASLGIWVAGIALSFQIPTSSNLIYVPDALLLIGFVPLLFQWRFSWPWLVFGVFNFGIGIFLGAIEFMPDNLFPNDVLFAKHHLAAYHPAITWWIFGGLAFAFGLARLTKNLIKMARQARSAKG